MNPASLSLSFAAGFLAALAPCALPMLPGYVAYYMNLGQGRSPLTYLAYSASTVAGFLSVYLVVGALPSFGVSRLAERVGAATPYIGALLVLVGLVTAFSDAYRWVPTVGSFTPKTVGVKAFLLYGVGYGLASMSCSLPVFMLLVLQSAGADGVDVAAGFLAYGLGAAAVIVPLTFAVAYSNQVVVERFMGALPYVKRLSALVLVAAGLYMIVANL